MNPITLPFELIKIAADGLCKIQILEDEIIFIYPDAEERKIKINSNGWIQFKDGETIHQAIVKGYGWDSSSSDPEQSIMNKMDELKESLLNIFTNKSLDAHDNINQTIRDPFDQSNVKQRDEVKDNDSVG
jgi:hypothetical protein